MSRWAGELISVSLKRGCRMKAKIHHAAALKKIIIYDEMLVVEFKSGLEVEIEA